MHDRTTRRRDRLISVLLKMQHGARKWTLPENNIPGYVSKTEEHSFPALRAERTA